jgi:hypothetical protein
VLASTYAFGGSEARVAAADSRIAAGAEGAELQLCDDRGRGYAARVQIPVLRVSRRAMA